MSSNLDLRHLENSEEVFKAFSRLISGGKSNYRTIIEKSKPVIKCSCGKILDGTEKFCPECGKKLKE